MNRAVRQLRCGNTTIEIGKRTLIMGILNATPDSFSDGGRYVTVEAAVEQARAMVQSGADIIDVGGESTRPGSSVVTLDEELERVVPVVQAIRRELDVPISVDTYKAETARQALEAGAHMINDIWGLKEDPDMAAVTAKYQCPVIVMHNRKQTSYSNLIEDMIRDLQQSLKIAHEAGIPDERIILDPGIGFAKTKEHNFIVMNHLHRFASMGYPVLLGTSRKSFIRATLDLPADDVVEGTAATVALGIAQGCDIMRVHDVRQMKRVAMMTDAIVRRQHAE